MQSDLKPCPFCGSDKNMLLLPTCDRNTPYNPADRAFPIVRCGGCHTDVPGKDFDASGKSAAEAWNRRKAVEVKKLDLGITREWFERRAKAEADLEIGAGFSVVSPSDADLAQMEVLAERALPQWAQDELARLRSALVDVPAEPVKKSSDEMLRLAVAAVLEADTEFRAHMPKGWEGDPLSDEIDGLRRCFEASPPLSRQGEDRADVDRLTRPVVGIENRTAQEVFDIMADRIRLAATRSGSPTTANGGAE